ncbi:hypothetical protein L249_8123 [Ophiocordyceps polyrhachis-furcata BCC 54312]|uniref:Uncharacterized protein n=1 Tax=Ophiocordyceps polyrhachis-furcata BCC 54312 TaxID=1330021 RepID=A0A367LI46_9HYPO|nr:hypothetical protein L249_8123 [Ophiocordyceps polyrhachis-furcata BCC 54312]
MWPTLRRLAQYIVPGTPTGLTGLCTHSTPRSTLLYIYSKTLTKLQAIPESSLYRQSVEAVTNHRISLVEQMRPHGHQEWATRAREVVKKHPEYFRVASGSVHGSDAQSLSIGSRMFVVGSKHDIGDVRLEEWNGEENEGGELEGIRTPAERSDQVTWAERHPMEDLDKIEWENEPQLTAAQIHELENQIGAGLIEEVIQVAETELRLVDVMERAKIWENLEEMPADEQWKYFQRPEV